MDKENMMKSVAANLRAVTQSKKGGVYLSHLDGEYRSILGSPIPYKKMGFSTLTAMIEAMPNVLKIERDKTGQQKVVGVADDSTKHIVNLISKQREVKSRRPGSSQRFRPRRPFVRYNSQNTGKRFHVQTGPSLSIARKVTVVPSPPKQVKEPPILRVKVETTPKKKPGSSTFASNYEVPPRFLRRRSRENPIEKTSPEPTSSSFKKPVTPEHKNSSSSQSNFSYDSLERTRLATRSVSQVIKPPECPISAPIWPPEPCSNMPSANKSVASGDDAQKKIRNLRSTRPLAAPPSYVPPLDPSRMSAKEYVQRYAETKDIPINYKTTSMGQKRKAYYSTLTVGKMGSFLSYPEEKSNVQAAEEEAASHAVKQIVEMEDERKKLLTETPCYNLDQIGILLSRVEEVLGEKQPNGMWRSGFPHEYETKFNEKLPPCWFTLVEQNLPNFIVKIEGIKSPIEDDLILRIPQLSGTTTPTSSSSRASVHAEDFLSPGVDFTQVCINPPALQLPESDQWAVFVTMVESTVNIGIRLCDESEKFGEMMLQMNSFYQSTTVDVESPIKNKLYAAYVIDTECNEDSWHRVRLEEIIENSNEVTCYFVDLGEMGNVSLVNLRELNSRFWTLPFEAVHISLYELEDYVQVITCDQLVQHFLGNTFIAKIVDRNANPISAVLYDTSSDDDVNVNIGVREKIIADTLSGIADNFAYTLPQIGNCHLAYARPDGYIFLRSSEECIGQFDEILEEFNSKFEEAHPPSFMEVSLKEVYVAKYFDDNWYRAMITAISDTSPNEVEVTFLDYGNDCCLPVSSIRRLSLISQYLASLPSLALPCTLSNVPPDPLLQWTEKAREHLIGLTAEEEKLLVRVDEAGSADGSVPAKVTIYSRNEESTIICINEQLKSRNLFREKENDLSVDSMTASLNIMPPTSPPMKPTSLDLPIKLELSSCTSTLSGYIPDVAVPAVAVEEQIAKLQATSISASFLPITPTPDEFGKVEKIVIPHYPDIPDVGSLFNVYVTWAANPANFVVQPLSSYDKLNELLNEMNQFYSNEENICDMHACLLKVGNFYAVHHTDNLWYRACLQQVVDDKADMLAVYFVDYGDCAFPSMSRLQPLWKKFHTLPCQAIKASLANVQPIFGDWAAEDSLKFGERVKEKKFASVIVNKRPCSEEEFGSSVLELTLIDTSSPKNDVYIHEWLIENNVAIEG